MRVANVLANSRRIVSKTDDIEILGSRSTKVIREDRFELPSYDFLFTPHTIWALISDRLATVPHCPVPSYLPIYLPTYLPTTQTIPIDAYFMLRRASKNNTLCRTQSAGDKMYMYSCCCSGDFGWILNIFCYVALLWESFNAKKNTERQITEHQNTFSSHWEY